MFFTKIGVVLITLLMLYVGLKYLLNPITKIVENLFKDIRKSITVEENEAQDDLGRKEKKNGNLND